jgi:hypothetical protein
MLLKLVMFFMLLPLSTNGPVDPLILMVSLIWPILLKGQSPCEMGLALRGIDV